jgi:hypothetical protein
VQTPAKQEKQDKQAGKAGNKRPAAATPQPAAAKKVKLEAAPATAPPKVQQGKGQPSTPGGNAAAGGRAGSCSCGCGCGGAGRRPGTACCTAPPGLSPAPGQPRGSPPPCPTPDPRRLPRAPAPRADKEYEQALLTFLKAEGKPVKLATVGSKVKKPPAVPQKMKAFVQERPKLFKIDAANDTISPA